MSEARPGYSLCDAARATGKMANRKLLKRLIRRLDIKTHRIGHMMFMDPENYERLLAAVKEYDSHPRPSRTAS